MPNKKSLLNNTKKWAITSIAILGLGLAGGLYLNNTHVSADTNIRPTVIPNSKANQNNPYPNDGKIVKPKVIMPNNKNVKPTVIPNSKANQNNPYPNDGKIVKPKVIMPGNKNVKPKVVMPNNKNVKPKVVMPNNKNVKAKLIMPNGKNIKPTVIYPNYNPNTNGTKNGRYNGEIIVPKVIIPKHIGQSKHYRHATITKISVPKHFRWFYITKRCLAHNHLALIGKATDYKYVLVPKHNITLRILNLYRISRHGHKSYQYEVKINGHYYYVTGNRKFTPNAYYQTYDLKHVRKSHGSYRIKVNQACGLYRRVNYNRKSYVKTLHRGKILRAKKVVSIGRKGDYQTRFMLKNRLHHHNLYVTSNKNFVKLL